MEIRTHCQNCGADYVGETYSERCKCCNAPKQYEFVSDGVSRIEYGRVVTGGCGHSPIYRADNEENGGVGCPICNAEQRARRAELPPFEPACKAGVCSDCIPFDGCIPLGDEERDSAYQESRDAAF